MRALLCFMVGSSIPAHAQLLFDHVTVADGLPGNEVLCVHEDCKGYVWAGTRTGLARLEGARIRTFFHDRSDSTSLAHDQVNAMAEDAQGRAWFATMAGLSLYDPVTGGFRSFHISAEGNAAHQANRMVDILSVGDTLLWVTTEDGLYRFDPRSNQFSKATSERAGYGPPGRVYNANELCWDAHRQGMWVGSIAGLAFWDARENRWLDRRNSTEPWFQDRNVQVPLVEDRDTLWFFTTHDYLLHGWDLSARTHWSVGSMGGERNHFTLRWQSIDPDGRHWLSTWTHRLFVHSANDPWTQQQPSATDPAALRSSRVSDMFTARNGDRWFATDEGLAVVRKANAGLSLVPIQAFEHGIGALLVLGPDTLLIGGYGDGLVQWRPSTGEERHARVQRARLPQEDRIWSNYINGVVRDQTGRILGSTLGQPVVLDPHGMVLTELPLLAALRSDGLFLRHTTFLVPDGPHHLWVGTWLRGLHRVDLRNGTITSSDRHGGAYGPLANSHALSMLHDSKDRWWLGLNDGGGLMQLVNGEFKTVTEPGSGNLGGVVRHMAEAPDGAIWLGTHEDGVVRYDPVTGETQHFGRRNGLPGVRIGHLFIDALGTLWACTDRGIAYLQVGSQEFRVMPLPAGLDASEVANAIVQLPDGRLVFGVGRYLLLFDPQHSMGMTTDLRAGITGFDINGKRFRDVLPSGSIQVMEDARALSFELAVAGAPPGVQPTFRFRTDTSQTWVSIGTSARLDLYDLPAGRHLLQVQCSVNGADWGTAYELPITIVPLLHRATWFRALMAALILVALALIAWLYMQARLRKQRAVFEREQAVLQERMRIAGDMHDDLGAGLSGLKLRSEMALRVEKDPAKRELLGSLARSAGDIITSMRQIIWTMNDDQGTLADLASYTGNHARTYCEANGLVAEVALDQQWPDVQLTSEQRRNIFLFVKEALHNVVKHAGASKVRLTMHVEGDHLSVVVADNGTGMPKGADHSIGNGLRNMHKRMRSLGGSLVHGPGESGRGTMLTAEVPIGRTPNKRSIVAHNTEEQFGTA